jgi:hypothetical protein
MERDYFYAGDRLALLLDWTVEGSVRRYVAVDHLNSTRVVVTDDGIECEVKITESASGLCRRGRVEGG